MARTINVTVEVYRFVSSCTLRFYVLPVRAFKVFVTHFEYWFEKLSPRVKFDSMSSFFLT